MLKSLVLVVLSVLVLFGAWNAEALQAQAVLDEAPASCFSEEETRVYRDRYAECGKTQDYNGKRLISEELGEEGAERLCREKGWEPLLRKCDKAQNHPQGVDQVWRSPDGKLQVIEAKGIAKGDSFRLPENRFGHKEGTPEWVIDTLDDTLRSNAASETEKRVARQVLEAAQKGEMNIHVICTKHVYGKPEMPGWVSMKPCTEEATRMAGRVMDRLAGSAPAWASETRQEAVIARSAAKSLSETAESMAQASRSTANTAKAAAEGTRAAAEGVEAATVASKALKCSAKYAGAVGVGIDVGVRSYEAWQVEQQFQSGSISQNERVKAHVENGASLVGGMGGATAGAYGGAAIGAAVGSIVPGPGTAIGGFVGGVIGGIGGYFGGDKAARAGVNACWK